jgi:hypothetical protein
MHTEGDDLENDLWSSARVKCELIWSLIGRHQGRGHVRSGEVLYLCFLV